MDQAKARSAHQRAVMKPRPSYAEQLKDVRWQKLRLMCLESAGWKCNECGCETKQLHVHHRMYLKGRLAWEYEEEELRVLCDKCHSIEHLAKDLFEEAFTKSDFGNYRLLLALLGGFLFSQRDVKNHLSYFAYKLNPTIFKDAATTGRFGMAADLYEASLQKMIEDCDRHLGKKESA